LDSAAEIPVPSNTAEASSATIKFKADQVIVSSTVLESKTQDELEVKILDYSEKSIVVLGPTKPIKDGLKALGALWNKALKRSDNSEDRYSGWILKKERREEVEALICGAVVPVIQKAAAVSLIDYSEKGMVLVGDTKMNATELTGLNGKWTTRVKLPNSREVVSGWVFSKKRRRAVEDLVGISMGDTHLAAVVAGAENLDIKPPTSSSNKLVKAEPVPPKSVGASASASVRASASASVGAASTSVGASASALPPSMAETQSQESPFITPAETAEELLQQNNKVPRLN
jgi:hypothetical protein